MIHINKIENIAMFKIKTGYSLELLVPETMKLLESSEYKMNKDKILWKCASFRNYWSYICPL